MVTLNVFGLFEQCRPQPEETGLYSQPGSSWTFPLRFPDKFPCSHLLLFYSSQSTHLTNDCYFPTF